MQIRISQTGETKTYLSVILFTEGACIPACTGQKPPLGKPPCRTPQGRHPLWVDTPPGRHPPGRHTPGQTAPPPTGQTNQKMAVTWLQIRDGGSRCRIQKETVVSKNTDLSAIGPLVMAPIM